MSVDLQNSELPYFVVWNTDDLNQPEELRPANLDEQRYGHDPIKLSSTRVGCTFVAKSGTHGEKARKLKTDLVDWLRQQP